MLPDTSFDSWDFNNIIWQDTSALDPSFDWIANDATAHTNSGAGTSPPVIAGPSTPPSFGATVVLPPQAPANGKQFESVSPASSTDVGSHALVEHFLASVVPPILASVEVGPRWTSTKMLFASLASNSSMVRYSVMAFSALQISGTDGAARNEHRALFDKAERAFSAYMLGARDDAEKMAPELQAALATCFFLSYSALLTNRVNDAQNVLREGAGLLRLYKARELTLNEKRLISWIRLVDGRASSAGGDGIFLTETDHENYSPETPKKASSELTSNNVLRDVNQEIEEILFDMLYTPGLVFYQRVQSIMARVSRIDPWHRARNTVADETEVFHEASIILKDLAALEVQRPALMDHAIAGNLNEKHLAKDIATAITRSYRTYFANYQAGYIHLHRVAHKHLPATAEVLKARATIKRIVRMFEQSNEPLPVNFIWPLLMACCEEEDVEERRIMIGAIRGMQSVASNAKPIADVLEEVHRRQDTTKQRADVRQASVDLFNMSFAVV
ncbi:hypothetical protein MBLNU230_g4070t1 [Neophaeotheca triangularis]